MQSTVDITPMETTWYLKKLLILWSPNYFEISLQIIVLCSRVNLEGKEYGGTIDYLSTRKSNFKTHSTPIIFQIIRIRERWTIWKSSLYQIPRIDRNNIFHVNNWRRTRNCPKFKKCRRIERKFQITNWFFFLNPNFPDKKSICYTYC